MLELYSMYGPQIHPNNHYIIRATYIIHFSNLTTFFKRPILWEIVTSVIYVHRTVLEKNIF